MATLSKKGSGGNINRRVNNNSASGHNFVKVKVLYYLSLLRWLYDEFVRDGKDAVPFRHTLASAADIAKWSVTNVKSVRVLLARWREASWGYVDARWFPAWCTRDGREHWLYRINNRGMHYINSTDKWFARSKEAKEAVINSGLLYVPGEDDGLATESHSDGSEAPEVEDCSMDNVTLHFPEPILRPIAYLPAKSALYVALLYPFSSASDIKLLPTDEAVYLIRGERVELRADKVILEVRDANKAFESMVTGWNIVPTAGYQELVLAEQRKAIDTTKYLVAKKYGLR